MPNKGKQRYKQRVIRGMMLCTLILSQSAQTYMGVVQATTQTPQIELNQAAQNAAALEAEIAKKKEEDEKQKEQEDLADSGLEQEPEAGDGPPENQGFEAPTMSSALLSPSIMDISPMKAEAGMFDAGSGNGTTYEARFYISNYDQLLAMQEANRDGVFYYEITTTINMEGKSWTPENFQGHLSGKQQGTAYVGTISNLTATGGGLFESLAPGATVENLNIRNATVTKNSDNLGILANGAMDAEIKNVNVQGDVTGGANSENIAGLVGFAEGGSIIDCTVEAGTEVTGNSYLGGLAGYTDTTRIYGNTSHADVSTMATGLPRAYGTSIGGFIGETSGTIGDINQAKNMATGNVFGHISVGGFIGAAQGAIVNAESTGNVTGVYLVGGLAGYVYGAGSAEKTKATGNVTASGGYVGGLIGYTAGSTKESEATGLVLLSGAVASVSAPDSPISATAGEYAGGLIGRTSAAVTDSFAKGAVLALSTAGKTKYENTSENNLVNFIAAITKADIWENSRYVGGLVGRAEGAAAVISGKYDETNVTSLSTTYATGIVVGGTYIGGLVGQTAARVYDASAGAFSSNSSSFAEGTSTVIGTGGYIGGLIGETTLTGGTYNANSGEVTNPVVTQCYSVGDVFAAFDASGNLIRNVSVAATTSANYVGGLIGQAAGATTANWAQGSVYGGQNIGGLIGFANTIVTNSYATGVNIYGSTNVGGLVGTGGSSTYILKSYSSNSVTVYTANARGAGIYAGTAGSVIGCVAIGGAGQISETAGGEFGAISCKGTTVTNCYRWEGFQFKNSTGSGTDTNANKESGKPLSATQLMQFIYYNKANDASGGSGSGGLAFKFRSSYGTNPTGPWIWGTEINDSIEFPVLGFGPQRPYIPFLFYLWATDTSAVYGTDGKMNQLGDDGKMVESNKEAKWEVYGGGRTLTVPISALFNPDSDSDYNNYTYKLTKVEFADAESQQAFDALGLNLNAQTFSYDNNDNLVITDSAEKAPFARGQGIFSYKQDPWTKTGAHTPDTNGDNKMMTFTFPEELDTVVGTYTIQARHNPTQGIQYSQMTFLITPKEIIVSGGLVNNKVFDGTKTATWDNPPSQELLDFGFGTNELLGDGLGAGKTAYDDVLFEDGETNWGEPEFRDPLVGTNKIVDFSSSNTALTGKNHKNYAPTLGGLTADITPLDVNQIGIEYIAGTTEERVYDGTDKAVIKTAPKVRLIYNPELMAEYYRRLQAEAAWEADDNPAKAPYTDELAAEMDYLGYFDVELGKAGDAVTYSNGADVSDKELADKTVSGFEVAGELTDYLSDELKAALGTGDEQEALTGLLTDFLDGSITAQKVTKDGYLIFDIDGVEVYKRAGKYFKTSDGSEIEDENSTATSVTDNYALFELGLITRKALMWTAPTEVDKRYDGTPFIAATRTDGSEVKFPGDVLPRLTGLVPDETGAIIYDYNFASAWAELDLGALSTYLTSSSGGNLSQGGATIIAVREQTENYLKGQGLEWWTGSELTDLGKYFVNNIGNGIDGQEVIDHIALLVADGTVYVSSEIRHQTKDVSPVGPLAYDQAKLTYNFVSGVKATNYKYVIAPATDNTPETAVAITDGAVKTASPIPTGAIIPVSLQQAQIRLIPGQVDDKEYDGTATATLTEISQRSNNAHVTRKPHVHMVLYPSIQYIGALTTNSTATNGIDVGTDENSNNKVIFYGGKYWEVLDPEDTDLDEHMADPTFAYRELPIGGVPYTFIHYADIETSGLAFDSVNVGEVTLTQDFEMTLPTAIDDMFTEERRDLLKKNLFAQASNPSYFKDFVDSAEAPDGLARLINRTCAQYYLKEDLYKLGDDGFAWSATDYEHQTTTNPEHAGPTPGIHNPNQDKVPEITPRRLVWTAGQVASKEYDSTKNWTNVKYLDTK